jgi:predicted RNA binding protein YcfA (HicA-like mRNA interferase family)
MAEKDISILQIESPELFQSKDLDGERIDDGYVCIDIPNPDKPYVLDDFREDLSNYPGTQSYVEEEDEARNIEELYEPNPNFNPDIWPQNDPVLIDVFSGGKTPGGFPGAPSLPDIPGSPPSDAMAFYLPFHFFYPHWWGIYLVQEWVQWFADFIFHNSRGSLPPRTCYSAARLYLYYHEHYHHRVESFATRLEIVHRTALYKTSFLDLYKRTIGRSSCREESLAEANAYLRTMNQFKSAGYTTKANLENALEDFMIKSPPGYKEGLDYINPKKRHKECQSEFAEQNLALAHLPGYRSKDPKIWDSAAYMFRGIVDRRTRCKYLINRNASILTRSPLAKPRYKMKQFEKKLRKLGCQFVKHKRKHDEWEGPNGKRTVVPRHSVEMAPGTMNSILKAFGLSMDQLRSA